MIRRTTAWAAAVLLTLSGCTAGGAVAAAPARPEGVQPPEDKVNNALSCLVRRSFAPSDVRPPKLAGGKLIAGVDLSDTTMSHWNATSHQFEGFNIDLLLAVARSLWPGADPRDKITFRAVPPGTGALAQLDPAHAQHVDVVATSLTATCERAALAYFSTDYLDSGQTALVRRVPGIGSPAVRPEFAGMEQLGGRRVCAPRLTTSLAAIRRYRTASGQALVPVQTEHSIDCLVMLRQGQVDAASTDENILRGFAELAPDTILVTDPPREPSCAYNVTKTGCTWFTDEPHAFAFSRGDEPLVRYFNYVLQGMRATPGGKFGEWGRAHDEWLSMHPDEGMPDAGPSVAVWPW
ncbi:glutamate ABC transporter substrate-binding protein [Winogradskya consettensis]|uniref:ABC transporter substrate-binding protein n=1 Tax=Winogradskya consettensis TaxID=113560 RepID=A0A919SCG4_9ACTN|nr:transporter substrate-binding domain-containing protein [Actinoplanes consettensis]GIM69862.1 ABC transporter substrate-binding protein [Actinoplanes consettensis]